MNFQILVKYFYKTTHLHCSWQPERTKEPPFKSRVHYRVPVLTLPFIIILPANIELRIKEGVIR